MPVAAMASAEPCKDLEPGLSSDRVIDEKGQLQLYQHARGSSQSVNSSGRGSHGLWIRDKMPSFRRLAIAVLIAAFLTVAYASVPVYRRSQYSPNGAKETSFQDLLNSVSDASLHDVLMNVYEKYKHGVFPEDRKAIQAVHDDNAAIATSLVELARRQNPNITSGTVSASSTAIVVVVPTTETNTVTQMSGTDTVVVVNTETTVTPTDTTPVQTTASQVSSNPPSEPSSSVPVPVQSSVSVQSVNSSPPQDSSTPAPVSPSPSSQANPTSQANPSSSQAPAQSSANGSGSTTATAAPGSASATTLKTSSSSFTSTPPSQASASTSTGVHVVTTISSTTEQIVYTTTFPNGGQSTVTSYTIVPAGEQASTPGVTGSTMTGTPSLQNGAVDGTQPRGMGLIGSLAAALIFVVGIL
jgi:hypothetical protein